MNKKGLSSAEIILPIIIFILLFIGGMNLYTSHQQKSRDAERLRAIKTIDGIILAYFLKNETYPRVDRGEFTQAIRLFNSGMSLEDPKHGDQCLQDKCGYIYGVAPNTQGVSDTVYEMSTAFEHETNLETKKDQGEDDNRYEIGTLRTTAEFFFPGCGPGGTHICTKYADAVNYPTVNRITKALETS